MDPTEFGERWETLVALTQATVAATIVLSAGVLLGTLLWWRRHRPLSKQIRDSLALSLAAALPGFVFSAEMSVRWLMYDRTGFADPDVYGSFPSTLLACLWVFVGPLLLAASWAIRSKVRCPRSLWTLQVGHALVLIASILASSLAMLFI